MKTKFYIVTVLAILIFNLQNVFAGNTSQMWSDISASQARLRGEQLITVNKGRYLQLDFDAMKTLLASAPMEQTAAAKPKPMILEIPMPGNTFQRFAMVESPVMHPSLAAKYPMIKTYSGQGLDNTTSTIRLDVTQLGFHAMILAVEDEIFIDPVNLQTTDTYVSYYKSNAVSKNPHICAFDPETDFNKTNAAHIAEDVQKNIHQNDNSVNRSAGETLRTYRLALACTGEYAATYGGTIPGAFAGMVTSVNRVTGVYEHEFAIRLTLIANDDTLVYIDGNTDPYTNNSGSTMLGENQTTVTSIIGSANYDIGHVFSTGGGGIAGLGVICQSSQKARGVTGLPNPVGDQFDIDFVAHEMGHQFGGNHTFNSVTGNCNGNRAGSAAYEPGSGITIMGYAGICGTDNLANHSIPYFSTKSFDEIQNYTTTGAGSTCDVPTTTGNTVPVSNLTVYHYDIPLNTPFKLTGAGSDPDGDTITYSFEEFDLGPGGAWNAPTGNAPIFMPITPHLSDYRLLPKLSNIYNNLNTKGEQKASYARTLNFRMTLRDNRNNGGGVTYDDTPIQVNVVNTTIPFAITYPDTAGIVWQAGTTQTVTWDVASSTAPPINTSNVNIYLSVHAGKDYPFPNLIAANVPNNGSYTFVVPNMITDSARILIEAVGNIFLDINNKNFKIIAFQGLNEHSISSETINVYPVPSHDMLNITLSGALRGEVNLNMTDAIGKIIYSKQLVKNSAGLVETLNLENFEGGIYFVNINTNEGNVSRKIIKL